MSDYISRQELKNKMYHEAFEKDSDMQKWDSGCWIRYKMFENAIDAAPTIDVPQWIPCAERLPEDGQMVLVTIKGHDVIICEGDETLEEAIDRVGKMLRVSVGFLYDDGWFGVDGYAMMVQPVAWMPLPEPWKGERCLR